MIISDGLEIEEHGVKGHPGIVAVRVTIQTPNGRVQVLPPATDGQEPDYIQLSSDRYLKILDAASNFAKDNVAHYSKKKSPNPEQTAQEHTQAEKGFLVMLIGLEHHSLIERVNETETPHSALHIQVLNRMIAQNLHYITTRPGVFGINIVDGMLNHFHNFDESQAAAQKTHPNTAVHSFEECSKFLRVPEGTVPLLN